MTRAGLDWWEYWIDIHIPALRRWTYPLIEGRPLEARVPRVLQMPPAAATTEDRKKSDGMNTGTNGATWQFPDRWDRVHWRACSGESAAAA